MIEMEDLVSIITPAYNCAAFLPDAIASVQSQTYPSWELIISDDCSTDGSDKLIASYQSEDKRIRYIRNDQKSGAAITRNNALKVAKGRWIAFLDSDDLWMPDKLDHQLRFMKENGYAFTYHEYSEISEDGEPLGIRVGGKKRVTAFDLYSCCWPGCLTVMYDAEKIGLVQIRDVQKNNDTAMWLRIIRKTECYLLKENLALYRRRKGSITPPGVMDRIFWHYRLFRDAEQMNAVKSAFWTGMNIIGSLYKKTFYVKRLSDQ